MAAGAFAVGGGLFASGAAVAQFGAGDVTGAWIYFVGGLFFNTGGYVSLLQAVNAPRQDDERGRLPLGVGDGGATSRAASTG